MAIEDVLDNSLTLQRGAMTGSTIGGSVMGTPATVATAACAIWPARAETVETFSRRDMTAEYEVATAVDIAAKAGDTLVIAGRTYTVIGYERFENALISDTSVYVTITGIRNQ